MKLVVEAIDLLDSMELATAADAGLYKRASRLAQELDQHLFDTLYHALALENDALLVTADDRYLHKAGRLGRIVALDRWTPPAEESRAWFATCPFTRVAPSDRVKRRGFLLAIPALPAALAAEAQQTTCGVAPRLM